MGENPHSRATAGTIAASVPRPSLNALRAFEATARLRSFSAAALELSVTHGAVSRHIRALEDTIGLPLLHRRANGASPTVEGQRLAEALSSAFALIHSGIEQIRSGPLTLYEFWVIGEHATTQVVLRDIPEEALDHGKPRRRRRREVPMKAWMFGQPCLHDRMFIARMTLIFSTFTRR